MTTSNKHQESGPLPLPHICRYGRIARKEFVTMANRERVNVNFFRPSTGNMKKEAGIATVVIILWALLSYGIPALIFLAGWGDPSGQGESFLTRAHFLGFPLHYWLIAQGCTIGYILLCKLYCLLWDKRLSKP